MSQPDDPVIRESGAVALEYDKRVTFSHHPCEALKGTDDLIICNEWKEFKSPEIVIIKQCPH